ncbi:hypothetical protein T11_7790 [Trichinella zimbabwensis]|uniref:Uncharacterized protein n=1 Tax=Trichinella zimbabwensis TaxID=268475 RepID=A0A0V1H9R8_9BILA|nr:hypothetical protein T11_7790 [Trichinella zimbabwensis]
MFRLLIVRKELSCMVRTARVTAQSFSKKKEVVKTKDVNEARYLSNPGKLQPLSTPQFDGDILQFKSFWGQFEASVNSRKELNDFTKFGHLRWCLSDAVLKAIKGVAVNTENYAGIIQTLKDKFHCVEDVVENHLLEECSDRGAAELTRLHDELNRHFLALWERMRTAA